MVGDSYATKLQKLNINTIEDLLHHYPARHIDRSQFTTIDSLIEGEQVTIQATVDEFKNFHTRTGKNLQQAIVSDETSKLQITWFNQRYLERAIKEGETYAFSGKVKVFRGQPSLAAPEFERVESSEENGNGLDAKHNPQNTNSNIHTGRLVPVYPETAGVSSKWLRSRINHTLKLINIDEHLPSGTTDLYSLNSLSESLNSIHFPESKDSLDTAKHRLAFDELFFLQLQGAHKRASWDSISTDKSINIQDKIINQFIKSLPFKLTNAQTQSTTEILSDLKRSRPMNRLLEGDVGSGKTVVAAIAIYATKQAGFQSVLMAPTAILAMQHYQELQKLFEGTDVTVGIKTSANKSKGEFDVVVGTHALLFSNKKDTASDLRNMSYKNLALVITDEQHRFGVKQRAALENLGVHPHRLTMSATPIPRTVALTLYGDLDVSIIDEMPINRKPVKTWVVPAQKRPSGYKWIEEQIVNGDQVFVVCPLIDPSESEKLTEVKSATQEFEKIKTAFPKRTVDLLHGRLKAADKDAIIKRYKAGDTNILVSTPVIEVGIDVPNATIIVIEAAERFGLAQLHQLRGRVGRGDKQSYCFLYSSTQTKTDNQRLTSLTKHNSGFKLAEIDLKLRGPGEVFGLAQHGFDTLKLARLTDKKLLQQTKEAAEDLVQQDPQLKKHPQIKSHLTKLQPQDIAEN